MSRRAWRRALKLAAIPAGLLIVYCAAHVTLALYPRPLFSHQRSHKNFTVHMREPVPDEITAILDRVHSLLAASDLNDAARHHRIYIFNNRRLARYLLLREMHFGANLPNGITYIPEADVAADVARCRPLGPSDRRRRTLSESMAHEITHALIRRRVGWNADRRLPSWIKEGYCEFVSRGSAVDLREGIARLKSGRGGDVPGLAQLRNRLLVEYLIRERGRTIEQILASPPDFRFVEAVALAALRDDDTLLDRWGWAR